MTAQRMFWLALSTGNLLLLITGELWWHLGWRWALGFLIAGPVVMVGLCVIALVLFMLLDGAGATTAPCLTGCGRRAPLPRRGRRQPPYCDVCEQALRRDVAMAAAGKAEEYKL